MKWEGIEIELDDIGLVKSLIMESWIWRDDDGNIVKREPKWKGKVSVSVLHVKLVDSSGETFAYGNERLLEGVPF
jgi:hypothetical protein